MRQKLMALSAITAVSALMLAGCAAPAAEEGSGELVFDVPDVPMLEALGEGEGQVDIIAW